MDLKILGLKELIEHYGEEGSVRKVLAQEPFSSFHCRNDDENVFYHNKMIDFQLRNKARTYFVVSDDGRVLGYFSLAINALDLSSCSSTRRKKISGGNKDAESYPAYLIGHLAKNDAYDGKLGGFMIEKALDIFREVQEKVSGRLVYLDCKDIPKLKKFYEDNGFTYFNNDSENELLQYYMFL